MNLPVPLRHSLETTLSEHFAIPVRVASAQNFPPSSVFRCALYLPTEALPNTVIVRVPRRGMERAGPTGLGKEHAALNCLSTLGSTIAPQVIVGGIEAGLLVTEDMGRAPSLLDLLLGTDQKAAAEGAIAFALSLGILHTQTMGQTGSVRANLPDTDASVVECWQQVQDALFRLGLPVAYAVKKEIAEMDQILAQREYVALSNGDPSVVNCQVVNGSVRFFDFEAACFRHALLDAAMLRCLYPTGGPAWSMPKEIVAHLEATYRTELARVYPAVLEDATYEVGMAAASAAWTIRRLMRLPRVDVGPDRDSWLLLPPTWSEPAPMRSRRRQLSSLLEMCISSARQANCFPVFTDWCECLLNALYVRWPEASETLPTYRAFT